jgi:undecaprenyl-diphosphatase
MSRVQVPSIAHLFLPHYWYVMNFFQAVILGLVQGLTEFFPISSSAHLKLAKWALHIPDGEHLLYFDLLCHAGTLLALVIYLRKEVLEVLMSFEQIALYTLAILPLVPAYFLLKPFRDAAANPHYLGYSLMVTSALLFLATRVKPREALSVPKWHHVLCIGIMQALALIPGISRSGSTIAAGRFCGLSWLKAARFSFLLSIPTILGGELLETIKMLKGNEIATQIDSACYAGGFIASFGLGLLAVRFVFWIYEKEMVLPFAWYCLGAGLFAKVVL